MDKLEVTKLKLKDNVYSTKSALHMIDKAKIKKNCATTTVKYDK